VWSRCPQPNQGYCCRLYIFITFNDCCLVLVQRVLRIDAIRRSLANVGFERPGGPPVPGTGQSLHTKKHECALTVCKISRFTSSLNYVGFSQCQSTFSAVFEDIWIPTEGLESAVVLPVSLEAEANVQSGYLRLHRPRRRTDIGATLGNICTWLPVPIAASPSECEAIVGNQNVCQRGYASYLFPLPL